MGAPTPRAGIRGYLLAVRLGDGIEIIFRFLYCHVTWSKGNDGAQKWFSSASVRSIEQRFR